MLLNAIKLYNFRNFGELSTDFSTEANIIVGNNAEGKTNLIEAINTLSTTKSFRTSQLKELVRWGEGAMSVFANITIAGYQYEIGFSYQGGVKQHFINNEKVTALDFISKVCCVSFTPTDLLLIKGSPELRRKFIDRYMADQGLIKAMLEYNHALKNKNLLLRQEVVDEKMVSVWNEILARTVTLITNARLRFVEKLEKVVNDVHSCYGNEKISLHLRNQFNIGKTETLTEEEALKKYEESLEKEIQYQSSVIGSHKDDLLVFINGHDARHYASQGQTRSLVLSLKMAVIKILEDKRGDAPILLLDDVDSELDDTRSNAFFDFLLSNKRQVFVTGTTAKIAEKLAGYNYTLYHLQSGKLTR